MSILMLPSDRRSRDADARFGFEPAARVGAAQRAALARGVTFALLLASSSLACVYVPAAVEGQSWVEGSAPAKDHPSR